VNEQSEHLSNAQIENYGDRAFDAGSGADHEAEQIEAHLDGCPSCRGRLLDFQRTNFALLADPKFVISKDANLKDTDGKPVDAGLSDAGLKDAMLSAPKLADSKFADLKFADLKFADPKFVDPKPEDPKFADAKFIDPKFTDPNHLTDQQVNTASTPDCPSEDDLRQLSAGLLPDSMADELTRHAATCDHCGRLLRAYTENFSDDFSPEEQAFLANLQSASLSWQRKTAQQMLSAAGVSAAVGASAVGASAATDAASSPTANAASTAAAGIDATANAEPTFSLPDPSLPNRKSSAHPGRKAFFWKWAFAPAATAACAAIAFSVWFTQRDTPEKVEKLLAQAYTEQRTMEMRWPGAEWGPMRVTRGPEDSRFTKSANLLKAEQTIRKYRTVDSKEWVRPAALAEILEDRPASAIEWLREALVTQPNSSIFKLDLAIAYAQQSAISADPKYRATAIELFNDILKSTPNSQEALFNLALMYTNAAMWGQAVTAWDNYLRVDPGSSWAQEAKQKREFAISQMQPGF
jgi:hypothetical protein